jgi:uncharacterized protein
MQHIDDIADKVVEAVESGDAEALRAVYSPDLVMVLYTDGVQRTRDEAIAAFSALRDGLRDVRLVVTDRQATPLGYVSQQVLHCTTRSGEQVRVPHCLITRVDGDRITRIDEYLDSAQLKPLLAQPEQD